MYFRKHKNVCVFSMSSKCWWWRYSISQEICTRFLLCCGYTLTDFPISIRLTSLALWQFNDCPSASKATLMNMDKYFLWINYERLHNHNKAKHNKTVCIFLGIYCSCNPSPWKTRSCKESMHQHRWYWPILSRSIAVWSLPWPKFDIGLVIHP